MKAKHFASTGRWMIAVAIAIAAVVSLGAKPADAFDVFYFKDSGGDGIWNNLWYAAELCPGDGGEFMSTPAPPGPCRMTPIPAWSSARGVHTLKSLNGVYPAGFWHARIYLRGTPPGATDLQVRLYREDGSPAPLCSGFVFLGMGTTAIGAFEHFCTPVDIVFFLGAVPLANERILALISTNRATTMQMCWNCPGAPSYLESTGFVARGEGDGDKAAPSAAPGGESSTWGSIKSMYRN